MGEVILGYQIACSNEWCSGPELFGWSLDRPNKPVWCPTCGGVADVRPLVDGDGDVVAEWKEWDVICPRCESKSLKITHGFGVCHSCGEVWEYEEG